MALFFDAGWFDEKLEERGLSRAALAAVAGLTQDELNLVFKDQRELSAGQVAAFAELLGETGSTIARQAGIATPGSRPGEDLAGRVAMLERRVAALEAELKQRLERGRD